MRKKSWVENTMSAAVYVERAAWWSRELTRFRARGPGDTENAMRTLESDYGLDYWLLWRLRYRLSQIRDIGVSSYVQIQEAYRAELQRQDRKIKIELERTILLVGPDHPAVVAAEALVGKAGPQSELAPRLAQDGEN